MKVEGNLRQRPNGSWQFRRTFGSHADGRPRVRSATFGDRTWTDTRARKEAKKISAEWDRLAETAIESEKTVAGLAAKWFKMRQESKNPLSPTTAYRYKTIIARITADLGHIQLDSLTALDIDHWLNALGQPKPGKRTPSATTILYYHKVLRAILQRGVKWDMVTRNRADHATPPDADPINETDHVPPLDELAVMLTTAKSRSFRMAVKLAAATGCRRGEVLGARWSDIREGALWAERAAYKVPGVPLGYKVLKNRKSKVIPLNDEMLELLSEFRRWQISQAINLGGKQLVTDGPIIANLKADPAGGVGFPPDWLSQEWERLCARHNVKYKFHGLRHLHGSILVDAKVPLSAAADRQGQTVETMEKHYLHPLNESRLAIAGVIGERMAPLWAAGEPPK